MKIIHNDLSFGNGLDITTKNIKGGLALVNFSIYNPKNYRWGGKYVAFSTHAKMHMEEFDLDALEVIDMLHDTVPCPGRRRIRRDEKEICSKKHRKIFRIILFEDYCYDVREDCWVVTNVKPA